jgi:hypothetical protein
MGWGDVRLAKGWVNTTVEGVGNSPCVTNFSNFSNLNRFTRFSNLDCAPHTPYKAIPLWSCGFEPSKLPFRSNRSNPLPSLPGALHSARTF